MSHSQRLTGLLPLLLVLVACHAAGTAPPEAPAAPPTVGSSTAAPAPTATVPAPSASSPAQKLTAVRPTVPSSTDPTSRPTTPAADTRFYGSFTPYPVPPAANTSTPGAGYRVVFSETLSRHGSRTVSSGDDSQRALALWQRAADAGALTDGGVRFAPAVRKLTAAMRSIGYGELSTRGGREQQGLGQREGDRLADYLARATRDHDQVQIVNTGVNRTRTSAESFVQGLHRSWPGLRVRGQQTKRSLHFGDKDAAYQKFLAQNRQWRAAYAQASPDRTLRAAATRGLRRLYSPDFVRTIPDPTVEARAIWDLYRAQDAMSADVRVDLDPFVEPATAAAFAFDQDAEWFYSRGPGVTGSDASYRAADPLLRDFFRSADRRLAGSSTAAVYRFAHDSEVAPFAARLELPGSTQLPRTRDVYSWKSSDFRLAKVTPLAGNIGWTLWRDAAGTVLLQVRHNEIPTQLGGTCRPKVTSGSFYEWSEVKRCLEAR